MENNSIEKKKMKITIFLHYFFYTKNFQEKAQNQGETPFKNAIFSLN